MRGVSLTDIEQPKMTKSFLYKSIVWLILSNIFYHTLSDIFTNVNPNKRMIRYLFGDLKRSFTTVDPKILLKKRELQVNVNWREMQYDKSCFTCFYFFPSIIITP